MMRRKSTFERPSYRTNSIFHEIKMLAVTGYLKKSGQNFKIYVSKAF